MIVSFNQVSKQYSQLEVAVQQVSFEIKKGEFTALAGPSGSGKTTLLNLAAGLDSPTSGQISLVGQDLAKLSSVQLTQLRRDEVGFVFQSYNLFPVLTALENVEYPLALKKVRPRERRRLAQKALDETGCGDLSHRRPSELSGGQQQRVAISRAIVTMPSIVFADEPTANLDSQTAKKLLQLFKFLNESKKITFLFSSHDPLVLATAGRIIQVADGKVVSDIQKTITPISFSPKTVSYHTGVRFPFVTR
jgi:putative ABC transport system ATP-binding protein